MMASDDTSTRSRDMSVSLAEHRLASLRWIVLSGPRAQSNFETADRGRID
jgi:hypothetical protein